MKELVLETISLRSPRGRLIFFGVITVAVYVSRYHWLDNLSLWKRLGITWAPSIGLTRAYWLVLHGDFAAAWHRNWLIYLVLAVGLPLLLWDVIRFGKKYYKNEA